MRNETLIKKLHARRKRAVEAMERKAQQYETSILPYRAEIELSDRLLAELEKNTERNTVDIG